MENHVKRTVSCCFSTLRQLRSIWRQVPTAVFQSLVVTLDFSLFDYCNSERIRLPVNLIRRLQSVQNAAAARPLFGLHRSGHITDALASLHWLRFPERIVFKVTVLTYRAVNGSAAVYLSSYFTRVADVLSRMRLRSSTSNQLIVPFYNLTTVGRRAFPVSAANLWNSLPAQLTSALSLTVFRQRLKTFLFRRSYPDLIIRHTELTFCCGPSSITLLLRSH